MSPRAASVIVAVAVVAVVAVAGCQPASPATPWLYGLTDVTTSSGEVTAGAAVEPAAECGIGATRTIRLTADVSPAPGLETVVASYADGVTVYGSEEQVLARTPGYACEGSADELDSLTFGYAFGEPTLVLAATTGGRREAVTWLGLFRPGFAGALDPVFTGTVEHRTDDTVVRGEIYLVPEGLLYRPPGPPPGEPTTFWLFDPVGRAYVPYGPIERHEPPHAPLVARPAS